MLGWVVGGYSSVAPLAIFLILAPSLLKMLRADRQGGFAISALFWFVRVRIAACSFAIVCVSVAFELPWIAHGGLPLEALRASGEGLLGLLWHSPYLWAVYASVAAAVILRRTNRRWVEEFSRFPDLLEKIGGLLTAVVPVFTFLVGLHVVTLPEVLAANLPADRLASAEIFGLNFATDTAENLLLLYLAISLLTGTISTSWHGILLARVRYLRSGFSVRSYFRDYFCRIYPLLWATSSEALATPLNLYLVRHLFPEIDETVRRVTIAVGSIFNINGTLTCCFVVLAATASLLGLPLGLFDLLLCFPMVFLIGFGVPGIPGELVLFAGPMMAVLGVPEALQGAFLVTFLGLQVGLPDAFRTGANSTDDCPSLLILDHHYGGVSR